jgi:mono/diheme cytochrome c family protein
MAYDHQGDAELEASTNRVMLYGAGLLFAMALVFPLYRWVEPTNRADARDEQLLSLQQQGEELFDISCSSCHGLAGEGGLGPALNSKQFLASATDDQAAQLIAVGIPGTQMSAYSQEFGGPLTSEQIRAITTFMRSWEETAPDVPEWRAMLGG